MSKKAWNRIKTICNSISSFVAIVLTPILFLITYCKGGSTRELIFWLGVSIIGVCLYK